MNKTNTIRAFGWAGGAIVSMGLWQGVAIAIDNLDVVAIVLLGGVAVYTIGVVLIETARAFGNPLSNVRRMLRQPMPLDCEITYRVRNVRAGE